MTANPVGFTDGILTYDFSTAATQAMGADQLLAVDGPIFALRAGDTDGNGIVAVADFNDFVQQLQTAQSNTYQIGDWNGDGEVNVDDFNIYRNNSSRIGIGVVRY